MRIASRLAVRLFGIASLCASALAAPLAAQTVGLAPAQIAELPTGAETETPVPNLVSSCLGELFDAGFIATDAPCALIERGEWEKASFGLAAAEDGMVDYVIAVYADWKPSLYRKGAWLVAHVDFRLLRVSDGGMITSGSFDGPADSYSSALDAERAAGGIGSAVGSACAAALVSLSVGGK